MAKEAAEEKVTHKYTVENLVKDLDVTPQSVRIKLRNKNVKKTKDGVYGWDTKAAYDDVVATLKTPAKAAKAKPAKKVTKPTKKAA